MDGWWVGLKGGGQQSMGNEGVNIFPSPQRQVFEGQDSPPGDHEYQIRVKDVCGAS